MYISYVALGAHWCHCVAQGVKLVLAYLTLPWQSSAQLSFVNSTERTMISAVHTMVLMMTSTLGTRSLRMAGTKLIGLVFLGLYLKPVIDIFFVIILCHSTDMEKICLFRKNFNLFAHEGLGSLALLHP